MAIESPSFDFERYESDDGLREREVHVLAEHLLSATEHRYSPDADVYSAFMMADEGQVEAVTSSLNTHGILPEDGDVSSVNIESQKYDVADGGLSFHEVTVRVAGVANVIQYKFNLQGALVGNADDYSTMPSIQRTVEPLYDKPSPEQKLQTARTIEADTGVSVAEQARLSATPSQSDLRFLSDVMWIMQH